MKNHTKAKDAVTVFALFLILTGLFSFLFNSGAAMAYVLKGVKWNTNRVPYYVNTANSDGIAEDAVIAAIQIGDSAWTEQSGADIDLEYAGKTSGTSVINNGKNEVFFRNASNGSAIATAYTYSSGDRILDTDIVFWDESFKFFTGASGCSGGIYVEDVVAHEFGHALGLGHSSDPSATMYSSIGYCSINMRYLAQDDIDAIRSLYGVASSNPTPTPTPTPIKVVR